MAAELALNLLGSLPGGNNIEDTVVPHGTDPRGPRPPARQASALGAIGGVTNRDNVPPQWRDSPSLNTSRSPGVMAPRRPPEAYVFDTFGVGATDLNGDGVGDVSHGDVVAATIKSLTGVEPVQVPTGQWEGEGAALAKMDQLLARRDVSNVFLNFSIDTAGNPEVRSRITQLAERGAQIFIAAGNDSINVLAAGLKHKNIHIVAASEGVIGETENRVRSGDLVNNPDSTTVANGIINPRPAADGSGGIDFNRDGKADIARGRLRVIADDASGKRLADVDATARVAALPPGTELHETSLKGVASIRTLRERGLIPDLLMKSLQHSAGMSMAELDASFMLVSEYSLYAMSLGDSGGMVLYRADASGVLSQVRQQPAISGQEATSWATPNALSQRLNAYRDERTQP
jgi:hypothetical protein